MTARAAGLVSVAFPEVRGPRGWVGVAAVIGAVLASAVLLATWAISPSSGTRAEELAPDAIMALAAVGAMLRGGRAFPLIGAGLLLWAAGDAYWITQLADDPTVGSPTVADAGYLALYPLAGVALVREVRSSLRLDRTAFIDAGIVVLSAVALVVAVVLPHAFTGAGGSLAETITNLAYPVSDLVLLSILTPVILLSPIRPPPSWVVFGLGLIAFLAADIVYLSEEAGGIYAPGGWVDAVWPLGGSLMALAAWLRPAAGNAKPIDERRMLAAIVAAGLAAAALASWDHFQRVPMVAVLLATGAVMAMVVRLLVALTENRTLVDERTRQALTDPLTGLPNRRAMVADLEAVFAERPTEPRRVAIYDLNLFKHYNDTFGHAAGDALLQRLGAKLLTATGHDATAYRMGGDEFCVLTRPSAADPAAVINAAEQALSEHGTGFAVTATRGEVAVPAEAATPTEALRVADVRMYRRKSERPEAAVHQAADVLVAALAARRPELGSGHTDIAELAAAVGRRLGLDRADSAAVARAAELHDVGKVAMPDSVLTSREGLTSPELVMLRRHPVVGERILSAASALKPVAHIVRSCQEHYDGSGWPDGLAGEEIPLAARIVAACAAFTSMTSWRPYRAQRSADEALDELSLCAGTQFDPDVVGALRDEVRARAAVLETAPVLHGSV